MTAPIKIWEPHEGSQKLALGCPIWELLVDGNRGGGKTDLILMDYLQEVGTGWGEAWRGIIFRQAYPHLADLIAKSHRWIKQIFPTAKYNGSEHTWTFADGEQLLLRFMKNPVDYWNYHGHEYPFIGWEELTNWATDECYRKMKACNRSSVKGIPIKCRSTCNPSGPGHAWVKERFIDNAPEGKVFTDSEGKKRVRIKSLMIENQTLMNAQPDYPNSIKALAKGDPDLEKAWLFGSWNIMTGGFFYSVWKPKVHILEPFDFPESWDVIRSFDWGSTKPWAVTYIAECNGEQPKDYPIYFTEGSRIIIDEVYGWNGTANEGDEATSEEIAERVLAKDKMIYDEYGVRVKIGPADTSIWEVRDGTSIGRNMATFRLHWTRAYKGAGSRIAGASLIRQMLKSAIKQKEHPRLYFFDTAVHHIRTLPLLQRDKVKPEDIDTKQEDHAYDALRYGLTRKMSGFMRQKVSH